MENRPFDTLKLGDTAELRRLCTADDLYVFAVATGNHNPMHLPDRDVNGDGAPDTTASGVFLSAMISAVLGNVLPGPGTLYHRQDLSFTGYAHAGDELVARVTVTKLGPEALVTLDTLVLRLADGVEIARGVAEVQAPTLPISFDDRDLPGLMVQTHRHFDAILKQAQALPALVTAVVWPDEPQSLGGAMLARDHGLIVPVLVGDGVRIRAAASAAGIDIAGVQIVGASSEAAAALAAVELVQFRKVQAIMKGHLHTDVLLRPMLDREKGLRIGRRFTHIFVMDVPGLPHPLLVSDAAINIAPDLMTKVDIVQNAIDLAHSLGIARPRVGVLSAVETVSPEIPSSMDAALLSKMAERGQITGGLVDGPLAMDNALDLAAARTKGIHSAVAGRAEVLIVPDLDAGNMLVKLLTHLAHAEAAGLVIGASVPVILTSRADGPLARLVSAALAVLHAGRRAG